MQNANAWTPFDQKSEFFWNFALSFIVADPCYTVHWRERIARELKRERKVNPSQARLLIGWLKFIESYPKKN